MKTNTQLCPADPRSKEAKLWRRANWPKGRSKAARASRAAVYNDLPSDIIERIKEIRRRKDI